MKSHSRRQNKRIVWTDDLRNSLAKMKKIGLTHAEIAARLGLTGKQVEWGWKLCREQAPSRNHPIQVTHLIKKVSVLRSRGFYRHEIAKELNVNLSRIDAAILEGRKKGINMEINARIYSLRQQKHGMLSKKIV